MEVAEVNNIIAEFCSEVISEPLCFFSEADLQAILFSKLVGHFQKPIETSIRRGPKSKGRYKTGLVHREYGLGADRRMDIVVFSRDNVRGIISPSLKNEKGYLKPRFGIELGTEKTVNIESHLRKDIEKVSGVSDRGYVIFFFRDTTSSDKGTESRKKTEKKIERILRRPLESKKVPSNVKVLCFLLRLARRHKRIFGKCELYDAKVSKWRKVNLRRTKQEVKCVLESPY